MRILILILLVGITIGAPAVSEVGPCEVCHLLVGEVQDLLTTQQTQGSISSYVNDACAKLPSEEKDVCNSFLKEHSGSLFNKLIKDLTPHEFCQSLTDVCPSNNEQPEPEVEQEEETENPSGNPLECELCKLAVLGIDKIIKQNRSSAAINDTLEKFCNDLPDQIKDVCIKIEPLILKGLTNGFEPGVVCKFATLCSRTYFDSESICASQKSCLKESELQRKQESESKPEVKCLNVEPDILKAILGGIDPTKACDFLKLCNDGGKVPISSQYIPCDVCKETLESMAGEIGIGICYQFKDVCGYEETQTEMHENLKLIPKIDYTLDEEESENLKEDAKCEICKYIIQLLNEAVGTNASIAQVNNTLFEICSYLPDNIKSLCPLFIPSLEKALADGLDPTNTCIASNFCQKTESAFVSIEDLKCTVCAQIVETLPGVESFRVKNGICNNVCHNRHRRSADTESSLLYQAEDAMKSAKSGLKGLAECEICKVFIRSLDGLAGENASIETVNNTVYEICTRLTGIQLQQACLQKAPELTVILKKGLDPEKTCVSAKFCTEHEHEVKIQKRAVHEEEESILMKAIREKERHNVGDVACDLCEGVIEILDNLLEDNATDEKINQTLYNLCSGLPSGAFQDLCMQIVPTIMTAVDNGFDPQTICTDVGLCTGRSKVGSRLPLRKKHMPEKSVNENEESILLDTIVARRMAQQSVGGIACDLCEGVIEILDNLLEENATDEKINQTLYNLCSGLPSGAFQDLCMQIIPTIMTAVENGFDPETVCTAAGLCTGKSKLVSKMRSMTLEKKHLHDENINNNEESTLLDTNVGKENTQRNLKDLKCEVCKAVIEELDSLVKQNASIEKINETLYDVCNQLPGALQDLCLQAAPQILNALMNGVDPSEACGSLGLCSSEAGITDTTEKSFDNVEDVKCEICTLLVQGLDEILRGNASVAQINATIFNLCGDLPGSAKSFCVMVAPVIVKELQGGADPKVACAVLKLCASKAPVQEESAKDNVGDIKCDICELIIKEIDTIVGQNASAEKINATIYNLCSQLPGTAAKYCVMVAPTIVKAVESGVDPQSACTVLKLCDNSAPVQKESANDNVGDIKCDICELIIKEIDTIVGQNASAEKINATIYNLCSQLPGTAAKYCVKVAPTIVKAVESGVDPQSACTALKLCDSSAPVQEESANDNVGDIKCDICELIIKEIDTIVGQNASAEKINATIYNLCSQLPGTAAKYCVKVAPTIVKAVESGVDPQSACTALKLCDSSVGQSTSPNDVGDIKCDICELIIKELDTIVGQNASADKINATIYNLCSQLPGTAAKYCVKVAPTIINAIKAGVDPQAACSALNLCASSDKVVQISKDVRDIKCDICELIIKEVDTIVGQNTSAEKINATIYNLCSQLPGTAAKYCVMVAPTIIKAIEAGVDPQAACTALNLCASSAKVVRISNDVGDIKCDICELIIRELDNIVGNNASADKINATIYNLCSQLPGTAAKYCQMVAPTIVKEIEGGVDPETACTVLKLCDASETRNNVGDIKCEICELAVRKLDELIGQNASKDKINSTMYQICNDLSGTSKIYCLLLAPAIVKEVEAGADPNEACKDLKLCTGTSPGNVNVHLEARNGPLDCGLCMQSLTAVFDNLSSDYVKVERTLLHVCSSLPEIFKKPCETLVKSDNGKAFKKVMRRYTPVSLCELANCRENVGWRLGNN
ncbi:uncharacterized protein LOC132719018 [Ruditapes philippinarum]|uniref:uncharacterized protein LOC132719018 n=1 Tax=Ruditapes philippinarum TaxID=129788 RepID=UPI00295C0FDE|nr:uncharacterized protein LOC132719018 [Ruditapes philippinarum]